MVSPTSNGAPTSWLLPKPTNSQLKYEYSKEKEENLNFIFKLIKIKRNNHFLIEAFKVIQVGLTKCFKSIDRHDPNFQSLRKVWKSETNMYHSGRSAGTDNYANIVKSRQILNHPSGCVIYIYKTTIWKPIPTYRNCSITAYGFSM